MKSRRLACSRVASLPARSGRDSHFVRVSCPSAARPTAPTAWIALFGRDALAEDAGVPATGSGVEGITLAHNASSEGEVDEVLAQAEAAGAEIIKSAAETDWGGYSGYFADPDGHRWEVAHNPHFPEG